MKVYSITMSYSEKAFTIYKKMELLEQPYSKQKAQPFLISSFSVM